MSRPPAGPAGIVASSPGYGGSTGIFCIVPLDSEDCSELKEAPDWSRGRVRRLGDWPPPDGPSLCCVGVLSFCDDAAYPFSRPSFSRVVRPVPLLPVVLLLMVRLAIPADSGEPAPSLSRLCFCRSFCCFRFRPCRRWMMISRIRGKYFSRLSVLAS